MVKPFYNLYILCKVSIWERKIELFLKINLRHLINLLTKMNLGRIKYFNRYVDIACRRVLPPQELNPSTSLLSGHPWELVLGFNSRGGRTHLHAIEIYLLKSLIRPKFIFVNKLIKYRELILRKNSIFLSQTDTHFFTNIYILGKSENHRFYRRREEID